MMVKQESIILETVSECEIELDLCIFFKISISSP